MITFDMTFDGRKPGMKLFRDRINKLSKVQLPKFKRECIKEIGSRCKFYMISNLGGLNFTGILRRSIHKETLSNDRAMISVEHGGAMAIETGFKPHFIHRNMLSGGGYKVGKWMDAKLTRGKKRNYVMVGTGRIGAGIHFVSRAYDQVNAEIPDIIRIHLKELSR